MRSPLWREFESGEGAPVRALRAGVIAGGGAFLCAAAVLPMRWPQQGLLAVATLALAVCAHRSSRSRLMTLALVLLSGVSTVRYAIWRAVSVVGFLRDPGSHWSTLDAVFLVALFAAESYAFAVLLLGYLQTAWPLERAPAALPDDTDEWPAVDVLIPTLNEPLELVRYTVLAAMNMDWPGDRFKVWILDDGDREEFRAFAAEAGTGYLARGDNRGAKAGNINHALAHTSAPFVAVFDCDQVPTRSFLQMTMGWLLRDAKLALVQTPHRFYSPDPFERNLAGFGASPSEEQLFHGVIQDGNDLWNAASFCGSCAVLRRSALDEVGGLATETVTEDVHTSLRLEKRGWNTAYINLPQAAGLATERLSAHVAQRVRWARGMMQMLRLENPLFCEGLGWQQRLCYLNEAAYFLCALPRLIFLLAPAAYLIFGRTALPGMWAAIVVYALPHLLLASLTRARIYGSQRQAFWNEIYETVMAPHILLPTLAALVNPGRARFHVTEKGSVVEREFYDLRVAWPYLLLLGWNGAALICGALRLHAFAGMGAVSALAMRFHAGSNAGAVWINAVWAGFNVTVLSIAAGAARESVQQRRSVRVAVEVPADVILAGGTMVQGVTCDLSRGGMRARTGDAGQAKVGDRVQFILPLLDGAVTLQAKVVSAAGEEIRAEFGTLGLKETEALTTLLYSRADAWLGWGEAERPDIPLGGLGRVLRLSLRSVWRVLRGSRVRKDGAGSSVAAGIVPALLAGVLLGGASCAARGAQAVKPARSGAAANAAAQNTTMEADLGALPRPFLETGAGAAKPVAIVFAAPPSAKVMQAEGIVASWLGVVSSHPVRFAVSIGTIPSGNAIVLAEGDSPMLAVLGVKAVSSPLVALRNNPSDPMSSVLLLRGIDADELLTTAAALALHGDTWHGTEEAIANLARPTPREPDDAPRWLSTDHVATFALARISGASAELQGDGSSPLPAVLRLPPDLYYRDASYRDRTNLALHLDYRYNAVPLGEGSTLQVYVNGAYVSSTPMPHTDKASEVLETVVPVPIADLRPDDNEFTFRFAFHAAQSVSSGGAANLMGAVLKDSFLDITGISHWTQMPDLELFARAGYPFTRRADLADTDVVLPDAPTTHELEVFLAMMARFGEETGLPAVNVTVTDASAVGPAEGQDLLILGTPQGQPALAKLDAWLPVGVRTGGLRVRGAEGIFGGFGRSLIERLQRWRGTETDEQRLGEIETAGELPDATIEEIEWPRGSGHTAVVIALRDDAAAAGFANALESGRRRDPAQSVSVLNGASVSSYRLGSDDYWMGSVSPWMRAEFLLEESPWLIAIMAAIVCFLFSRYCCRRSCAVARGRGCRWPRDARLPGREFRTGYSSGDPCHLAAVTDDGKRCSLFGRRLRVRFTRRRHTLDDEASRNPVLGHCGLSCSRVRSGMGCACGTGNPGIEYGCRVSGVERRSCGPGRGGLSGGAGGASGRWGCAGGHGPGAHAAGQLPGRSELSGESEAGEPERREHCRGAGCGALLVSDERGQRRADREGQ